MAKSPGEIAREAIEALDRGFARDRARLMEMVSRVAQYSDGAPVAFNDAGEVFVHPDLLEELNKPGNARLRQLLLVAARGPLPDGAEMAPQQEASVEPPVIRDTRRTPATYAEAFRRGEDNARIKSFPDALLRAILVGTAIFIALLCPVIWYWKIVIFLAVIFVIGLIVSALQNRRDFSR